MSLASFAVIALGILCFGLVSGRLQRSFLTPPMVFVLFGLLLGEKALGLLTVDFENSIVHALAEITLVLVLFTDAARIDVRACYREHNLAARLLLFGIPLTVLLGTLVAVGLFDRLSLVEAAVLAVILAPTDAALGQAVVSNPRVPARVRQTLNIESGLNDGIMLPVLLILMAAGGEAGNGETYGHWIRFAALQILLGPLAGAFVGYAGGRLIVRGAKSGWMTHTFQDLSALGLSVFAYAGAELIGGNGFIAAFFAGLTLGNTSRGICTCLYEFAEAEGQLLNLLIFLVFGSAVVPALLAGLNWQVVLYALFSLTVVRMLPVALSMTRARLMWDTTVFLAWFGPRGLASILFVLLMLEETALPLKEEISLIAFTTVAASVFLHGVTSHAGASWYSSRMEAMKTGGEGGETEEHRSVTEMPVRIPYKG
jgi:NhaP-type Na+/H+ or K+/H+ antiporter